MKKNPLNIVLFTLVGVFIVLVALFIRQITRRPQMQARLDGGTSNVVTSSVIPTPASNPTTTSNATLSGQTQTTIDAPPVIITTPASEAAELNKGGLIAEIPTLTPTPVPAPAPTPAPKKTIVTQVQAAPSNKPSRHPYLSGCGEYNQESDTFNAIVKLPAQDGKNAMTAQVGSSHEKNDLFESSFPATSEQTIHVPVKNNTNYYVRYQFDGGTWSDSLEFSCARR